MRRPGSCRRFLAAPRLPRLRWRCRSCFVAGAGLVRNSINVGAFKGKKSSRDEGKKRVYYCFFCFYFLRESFRKPPKAQIIRPSIRPVLRHSNVRILCKLRQQLKSCHHLHEPSHSASPGFGPWMRVSHLYMCLSLGEMAFQSVPKKFPHATITVDGIIEIHIQLEKQTKDVGRW